MQILIANSMSELNSEDPYQNPHEAINLASGHLACRIP